MQTEAQVSETTEPVNASKAMRNAQVNHPDDFYQQVLTSFRKKSTQKRDRGKQQVGNGMKNLKNRQKTNGSSMIFLATFAGFWIRFFAYLVDVLVIRAITQITIVVSTI